MIAASLAACSDAPTSPATSSATKGVVPSLQYSITDLQGDLMAAGFDGAFGIGFDVDNAGRVLGAATVNGGPQHGFIWAGGRVTSIGTLGGDALNSQAGGSGTAAAVVSEIAETDPLAEDFCGFGSSLVCRGAVWQHGVLTPLPTLGGRNAAAIAINGRGQIVGLAEDGVLDNGCVPPLKSHFQAVVWENGQIRKLPPLPGDEVALAVRNNENGLVVGTSGLCSNTYYAGTGAGPHAVVWDNGVPTYLGDFGDHTQGFAAAVNDRGEVFGAASYPGGSLHAFRWTRASGMQDIGLMSTDPSDAQNTPFQANDKGQLVGASCDAPFGNCRGYIWQNGVYTDLNTLTPPDSKLYVVLPLSINEAGQITGLAVNTDTFEPHVVLLTPGPGNGASRPANAGRRGPPLPQSLRRFVERTPRAH
jgi:probable HAF family extracellular repeat protein